MVLGNILREGTLASVRLESQFNLGARVARNSGFELGAILGALHDRRAVRLESELRTRAVRLDHSDSCGAGGYPDADRAGPLRYELPPPGPDRHTVGGNNPHRQVKIGCDGKGSDQKIDCK